MSVIAYVRRNDGDDEQQHHDIAVLGIDLLYEDRGNSRDGLTACLRSLKHGDCLVVTRLSQFMLGAGGMIRLAVDLRGRGVHLVSLAEAIDTRSHSGWSFYQHLIALAAMEHELARDRAEVSLATVGRARGRAGGRKLKLSIPAEDTNPGGEAKSPGA